MYSFSSFFSVLSTAFNYECLKTVLSKVSIVPLWGLHSLVAFYLCISFSIFDSVVKAEAWNDPDYRKRNLDYRELDLDHRKLYLNNRQLYLDSRKFHIDYVKFDRGNTKLDF